MPSAKSGPNLWQIWQVFGPWASPHGANGQVIMTVHNYRPRQFHRTSNGENPSNGYRDMGSASLAAARPPARPPEPWRQYPSSPKGWGVKTIYCRQQYSLYHAFIYLIHVPDWWLNVLAHTCILRFQGTIPWFWLHCANRANPNSFPGAELDWVNCISLSSKGWGLPKPQPEMYRLAHVIMMVADVLAPGHQQPPCWLFND